ncbi:hypothetical protein [Agromyces sp. GXQ0307]|uniref:hypothetical protein n=1 Tax=Agromyces sp. GXQ0307 TaxID=3377835 RepID=UPI00383B824C
MHRMPRVHLRHPPLDDGQHRRDMPTTMRVEPPRGLQRAGAIGDRPHARQSVPAELPVRVIRPRRQAIEPVVDDREPELERLHVGEELRAIDVVRVAAAGLEGGVHACAEG